MSSPDTAQARLLDPRTGVDALVRLLAADGYRVIGPVYRDGVIAYDDVATGDDLPTGVSVAQAPGRWRGDQGDDPTRFGWTPGADSFKRYVFPPRQEVLRIRRTDGSFVTERPVPPDRPLALIGARDCEVTALDVLDEVLLDQLHPDPRYAGAREGTFVVAVTCGRPSATCWCTSMGGGPEPRRGFDVRLTEVYDGGVHVLVAVAGSERGNAVLARLDTLPATDALVERAAAVAGEAAAAMPVRLPGADLPDLLDGTALHPHWDDVAARCLSCGNCTMVCPTCFCSSFSDATALGSGDVARVQEWASCFQLDHSNLAGHPVRATTASRYRQWLTHKLQSWPAQFGSSGCVGCGRCTTWCPAGIDIAQEAGVLIGTPAGEGRP